MKKKSIFSIIMILILTIPNTIFAFVSELGNVNPNAPEGLTGVTGIILGAIQWVGYAIAIGMLLYIGIKYMMSAANEKANMKQTLINYLIGAIVLFGAVSIFSACINFFSGVNGDIPENPENPGVIEERPIIGG